MPVICRHDVAVNVAVESLTCSCSSYQKKDNTSGTEPQTLILPFKLNDSLRTPAFLSHLYEQSRTKTQQRKKNKHVRNLARYSHAFAVSASGEDYRNWALYR